ncbi:MULTISPECIES: tetratricopeptide repeat protein [unclassified Sphingomonas]|uniref:tetratricopeptide repeat protein n=1 Tax=unclassified Sphingomonas TaxID=196159 RepID=UPI002269FB2C|nr:MULTISPECIES: tetratricopeptide repeat protein [unclassified Sphingomonas]
MELERFGRYTLAGATVLLVAILVVQYRPTGHLPNAPSTESANGGSQDSVATLEAKVAAQPRDAPAWVALGRRYFAASRYTDATQAYAHATAIDPGDAADWSALGEAMVLANKAVTDDAAHAFRRALDADPHDARARYFLGVRQDLSGDHRGAVAAWIDVLNDSPPDAPWVDSVRALVRQVAARYRIDVAERLHPVSEAAHAAAPFDGQAVAAAAIPGPDDQQITAAARLTPSDQDRLVRGMIERLAARLDTNPDDAAGWIRLMRARSTYGDAAGAKQTLERAKAVFAGRSGILKQIDIAAHTLGLEPG